ncbi:MAG: carboxypeptidase regulatory-like domain-containing protein [Planctomycetes bacterium]|nr:carboxypeptidase regulatory-like domain-containing protein [Planctomycetota bacterium]
MSTNGLKSHNLKRGSAAWLLVLLVIVGAGLFAWLSLQGSGPDSGITRGETSGTEAAGEHIHAPDLQAPIVEGLTTSSRVEAGPLPYRKMKQVFDGRGQISGELLPNDSGQTPETWTLVIEPSQFASGREMAERREIEFPGNQTTFEVRDLPMASYRVSARAKNQASVPIEVSLFKIEGLGHRVKDHSHVMLRMQALSVLHIALQAEDLSPASDVSVVLESKYTRQRWEAVTDVTGHCKIADLPAGQFSILVGYPDQPLLPRADVQISRDKPSYWKGVLPKTYPMTLRVIDEQARPLPGAIVRGHGGAPIDGITDYQGELTLQYLPAGTYRLRAEHAASESHGRVEVTLPLEDSQPNPVIIYCRQ